MEKEGNREGFSKGNRLRRGEENRERNRGSKVIGEERRGLKIEIEIEMERIKEIEIGRM